LRGSRFELDRLGVAFFELADELARVRRLAEDDGGTHRLETDRRVGQVLPLVLDGYFYGAGLARFEVGVDVGDLELVFGRVDLYLGVQLAAPYGVARLVLILYDEGDLALARRRALFDGDGVLEVDRLVVVEIAEYDLRLTGQDVASVAREDEHGVLGVLGPLVGDSATNSAFLAGAERAIDVVEGEVLFVVRRDPEGDRRGLDLLVVVVLIRDGRLHRIATLGGTRRDARVDFDRLGVAFLPVANELACVRRPAEGKPAGLRLKLYDRVIGVFAVVL